MMSIPIRFKDLNNDKHFGEEGQIFAGEGITPLLNHVIDPLNDEIFVNYDDIKKKLKQFARVSPIVEGSYTIESKEGDICDQYHLDLKNGAEIKIYKYCDDENYEYILSLMDKSGRFVFYYMPIEQYFVVEFQIFLKDMIVEDPYSETYPVSMTNTITLGN